jgi:hypothetical protein
MLTETQINEVKKELIQNGLPVRFLINGQCVNLETGEKQKKGINVMHQIIYWNFSKQTSLKIAKWINATPVFDKS